MCTLDQAAEIIAQMKLKLPGSASFGIKMVNGDICQINPNSFVAISEDGDITLDANNHWATVVTEASAGYMKQD